MPPSHSFWVILIGKTPTSFRAKAREDLVPTLRQLQRTQTDVTLRWFERGKVWESPEAAIGAAKLAATEAREKRAKEWRPGGEHRDPKARLEMTRDQKRAKFKREQSSGGGGSESPFGPRVPRPPRAPRPQGSEGRPARSPFDRPKPDRPSFDRPKSERPKPGRPFGDRPARRERPPGPPMQNPFGERPPKSDRGGSKPPRRRS